MATTEQVSVGIEAEVELRPLRVPPGQEAKEQAEQVEAAAAGKAAATTATAAATAAKVAAAEPAQDGSTVACLFGTFLKKNVKTLYKHAKYRIVFKGY